MTGPHTQRAGDPGAWNSETIPAAFSSSSPDVTAPRNRSLGPSAQGSRVGLRRGIGCSSRQGSVNPIGSPGRFALPSLREPRMERMGRLRFSANSGVGRGVPAEPRSVREIRRPNRLTGTVRPTIRHS